MLSVSDMSSQRLREFDCGGLPAADFFSPRLDCHQRRREYYTKREWLADEGRDVHCGLGGGLRDVTINVTFYDERVLIRIRNME